MKKGLLKKAALVAAIGTALMGIPETTMASELENDNTWLIEECGPEGMLEAMEWLSIEEIAEWADTYGYDWYYDDLDGAEMISVVREDPLNIGKSEGSGSLGKAALESGSGYILGAADSISNDITSGNAMDSFVDGAIENTKESFMDCALDNASESWHKSRDNGDGVIISGLKAFGAGLVGGIFDAGKEGIRKSAIDTGKEIAQNANSQGIDNAIQGYDSVMNDDGETKYIIYDYVFENGSISCSYMSETLPVENRYGLSDTIQKHFTPVEEYDLSEYRDYNVYRSNDGTYYLVGPIFLGDTYQNYYIPWTYEDMGNMIVSLADFYR
ncbi:MAG: hypothetical protein K6G22_03035 [Lachnospiraceae bacterium]|nr:hypothetical protein [Lachnospiraceae bacterium]